MKPLAKWEIINHGICVEHNFPCPVCHESEAVVELWHGLYQPCWNCQWNYHYTVSAKSRFQVWLLKTFFGFNPRGGRPAVGEYGDRNYPQKDTTNEKENG